MSKLTTLLALFLSTGACATSPDAAKGTLSLIFSGHTAPRSLECASGFKISAGRIMMSNGLGIAEGDARGPATLDIHVRLADSEARELESTLNDSPTIERFTIDLDYVDSTGLRHREQAAASYAEVTGFEWEGDVEHREVKLSISCHHLDFATGKHALAAN